MAEGTFPSQLTLIKAVVLVALLTASALMTGVLAAEYTVTDLGTLGGSDSFASGINAAGQVVGVSRTTTGDLHAFLYSGDPMIDLDTLGGMVSSAAGINADGQIVGHADLPGNTLRAFLYRDGRMIDLTTLGGSRSVASGINPNGQVVGQAQIPGNTYHAFLYSDGSMTDLNTLIRSGITLLNAKAINAAGQIVGEANIPSASTARHAFLYSPGTGTDLGTVTDLGTLGGTHSVASGINATGQVVGSSYLPGDRIQHAFLYSRPTLTDLGTMTDLGTLGGRDSFAYGINAAGQVVGRSDLPGDGAHHAFRYRSCSKTMTDLNDLVRPGIIVTNATAINTAGQIVGDGRINGSPNTHALLLTPELSNRFAYARVNEFTIANGTLDSRYAYNASGGAISLTRQGVGLYDVTFDNLPAWGTCLSSAVAVTAYGSSPSTCSVVAYDSAAPSRTVAQVACFDVVEQRAADAGFTIMIVGNQSLPHASAFVMSGGPAPNPGWTNGRFPIKVTRNQAPGDYNVDLGTGNTQRSVKLVTSTTTGPAGVGTRCTSIPVFSGGLQVQCYDRTGAATDQSFSVVQVAGGRPERRLGFALADQAGEASYAPHPSYAFNSAGGAITATRASDGHYAMHFAGLQKVEVGGHVQVRSHSLSTTCNVVGWDNAAGGLDNTAGLQVEVECRNEAGQFKKSEYTVLVIE